MGLIENTNPSRAQESVRILALLNEVRLNLTDLNLNAARTNLNQACELAQEIDTSEFDEEILIADGLCTALEFQQTAPVVDRNRLQGITAMLGRNLKLAL